MEKASTLNRMEQRAVIKFCAQAGMTPTETYKFLQRDKTRKVCRTIVFEWHDRFSKGRTDLGDNIRRGRPSYSNADVASVQKELETDRQKSIDEISSRTGLSHGTTHKILSADLGMHKVCARWVPRLLRPEERESRVAASREFLRRWETEGTSFPHRIVTTDETWLSFYDPETKQASMIWKTADSPPHKKARTRSTKKTMFIFFMDSRGMLLQHAVPQDQTVNKEYYRKVLRRDLTNAIRKKRPGVAIEELLFHQDNAPSHRATDTLMTIDFLGYERINHAPYSPDFGLCRVSATEGRAARTLVRHTRGA